MKHLKTVIVQDTMTCINEKILTCMRACLELSPCFAGESELGFSKYSYKI